MAKAETDTQAPESYDILIAGGGVSGCAAALAISRLTPYSVAVIERHPPSESDLHPSFDARVIALAQRSIQILRAWHFDIDALASGDIKHIHVSDRKHLAQVSLNAEDEKVDALGKVIRLESLGLSLYAQLQAQKIPYFTPEKIESISRTQHAVSIVTDKRRLQAKLLVVAEGASSSTREMLGIPMLGDDYGQSAVISNVSVQLPHQDRAFERFSKYGPIALLPMSDDGLSASERGKLMSLVWTTSADKAEHILALDDRQFLGELGNLFGTRLGKFTACTTRYSYPLILKRAEDFVSHRVVCVGNAAQSLHPIAGQGFNLGLRDIHDLAMLLSKAHRDDDAGAYERLANYRKMRQADKREVINATDALVRGFSNHYLPLVLGRNKALALMNTLGPIKTKFAQRAMGLR
uniref:2-octaprenyl-6-methoxyphenyl hydroxylase n=1 Tax=Ningiella ruwaisensis TaxID=2364274 RepID=UPI0010A041DA|nr:2-octaprenyl-6-methoxyphenyl hydroxylase [Ningiella ruwaisensis]